jgi:hypothetical protein
VQVYSYSTRFSFPGPDQSGEGGRVSRAHGNKDTQMVYTERPGGLKGQRNRIEKRATTPHAKEETMILEIKEKSTTLME